ncbi:MAG: Fe-S cluster assembly protein SufD [Alphaproteobacteria bacterium]|nr:Fe-S cluster assembly protein SufD [Alphaproteobacteria bacterium]
MLDVQNLPSPTEERWKYTNLPRAVGDVASYAVEAPREIVIHKNSGWTGGNLEEIVWTGVDGALQNPRLKIVLEEGAQLTLIERHNGAGRYWKNMASEIELGRGAVLNHVRLQEDGSEGVLTDMAHLSMGRDSVYNGFTLNIGGALVRHDVHAVLSGENGECSYNGINLLNGAQHVDTTILMEHMAARCRSNQFYRSVLDGKARGVFQGKVHVHEGAQKTDGYQLSNAILLSPDAEMDTKPELEIYADDVKCSHGATTGQLDEEPLFYLRSRGLNAAEARFLLMQAFVDEVVDKIVDEGVRAEVSEKVEGWLKGAL